MTKLAIICVDDDRSVLRTLEEQLERLFGNKYIYEVSETADEAIELIDELLSEGFETITVISDWAMPGMKGDDFMIHLQQYNKGIIKVLLSGQVSEEGLRKAKDIGKIDHFIQKPWKYEDLRNKLYSSDMN